MRTKLNCLSYWYPKIEPVVPTPKTVILRTDLELLRIYDFEEKKDEATMEKWRLFLEEMKSAAKPFGTPFFLRTGQGSGKHGWKDNCFVQDVEKIGDHILSLVEWSECVDIFGLPSDVWVIREFLQLQAPFSLPGYGDMPIAKEFRCFVDEDKIRCIHPYWPENAIEHGRPPGHWKVHYEDLLVLNDWDENKVRDLASKCGKALGGSWSVDICVTLAGEWVVTDCAVAENSWHWPECKNK